MDPWSKGDYSRHIRKAIMAMEELPEGFLPPAGCRDRSYGDPEIGIAAAAEQW